MWLAVMASVAQYFTFDTKLQDVVAVVFVDGSFSGFFLH